MSTDQGHQRPDMLVETDWLQEYLDDPQLRIVDMGPIDGFKRGHIPNAIGLDRDYFKDSTNEVYVMPRDQFAKAMGQSGIGNEHHVVAYDEYGGLYAARLWWALRLYGHEQVWILNGGWNKWLREGRPWTQVPITGYHSHDFNPHPKAEFVARPDTSLNCIIDGILDNLSDPNFVTLDVRSRSEYDGTNKRGNRRGGHMPGTVHIEWSDAVTDDDLRTFKPPDELRKMFELAGITPEKDIVTY
ncbi:MAG: sulfurtransferase [Dehalococcoidia bacterium]